MTIETEVVDLRQRVVEAEARAEAMKLVQEISAGAAHNFNNVLQIIMSSASMIEMTEDKDKINKYAKQILDATLKGNTIANRLSRFAKTLDDHSDPQPVNISELVANTIENTRVFWYTNANRAGAQIHVKKKITPNLTTVGVEGELSEVLINLIKNACEAMTEGGTLYISAEPGMGSILIKVTDTGAGVTQSGTYKVFTPFYTTKGDKGTGMGLATCRQIIERHDGSISLSSSKGHTTFTIALPDTSYYISSQP